MAFDIGNVHGLDLLAFSRDKSVRLVWVADLSVLQDVSFEAEVLGVAIEDASASIAVVTASSLSLLELSDAANLRWSLVYRGPRRPESVVDISWSDEDTLLLAMPTALQVHEVARRADGSTTALELVWESCVEAPAELAGSEDASLPVAMYSLQNMATQEGGDFILDLWKWRKPLRRAGITPYMPKLLLTLQKEAKHVDVWARPTALEDTDEALEQPTEFQRKYVIWHRHEVTQAEWNPACRAPAGMLLTVCVDGKIRIWLDRNGDLDVRDPSFALWAILDGDPSVPILARWMTMRQTVYSPRSKDRDPEPYLQFDGFWFCVVDHEASVTVYCVQQVSLPMNRSKSEVVPVTCGDVFFPSCRGIDRFLAEGYFSADPFSSPAEILMICNEVGLNDVGIQVEEDSEALAFAGSTLVVSKVGLYHERNTLNLALTPTRYMRFPLYNITSRLESLPQDSHLVAYHASGKLVAIHIPDRDSQRIYVLCQASKLSYFLPPIDLDRDDEYITGQRLGDPVSSMHWLGQMCTPCVVVLFRSGRIRSYHMFRTVLDAGKRLECSTVDMRRRRTRNSQLIQRQLRKQMEGQRHDFEMERPGREYEVTLIPDPDYGLGLHLEMDNDDSADLLSMSSSDTVKKKPSTRVSDFKRHPVTNEALPAQRAGLISIGDCLVSINRHVVDGLSLEVAIDVVKMVTSMGGVEERGITMRFRSHEPDDGGQARTVQPDASAGGAMWYTDDKGPQGPSSAIDPPQDAEIDLLGMDTAESQRTVQSQVRNSLEPFKKFLKPWVTSEGDEMVLASPDLSLSSAELVENLSRAAGSPLEDGDHKILLDSATLFTAWHDLEGQFQVEIHQLVVQLSGSTPTSCHGFDECQVLVTKIRSVPLPQFNMSYGDLRIQATDATAALGASDRFRIGPGIHELKLSNGNSESKIYVRDILEGSPQLVNSPNGNLKMLETVERPASHNELGTAFSGQSLALLFVVMAMSGDIESAVGATKALCSSFALGVNHAMESIGRGYTISPAASLGSALRAPLWSFSTAGESREREKAEEIFQKFWGILQEQIGGSQRKSRGKQEEKAKAGGDRAELLFADPASASSTTTNSSTDVEPKSTGLDADTIRSLLCNTDPIIAGSIFATLSALLKLDANELDGPAATYVAFLRILRCHHALLPECDAFRAIDVGATAMLLALLSKSQTQLLSVLKSDVEQKPSFVDTWSYVRQSGVHFWIRRDEDLLDFASSLASAAGKDCYGQDPLDCAIFFTCCRKLKALEVIAQTDRASRYGASLVRLLKKVDGPNARKVIVKNAHMLLSKRRYLGAAALFLIPEEPLLTEALGILRKHVNDWSLVYFVSRVVEARVRCASEFARSTAGGGPNTIVYGKQVNELLHGENFQDMFSADKVTASSTRPVNALRNFLIGEPEEAARTLREHVMEKGRIDVCDTLDIATLSLTVESTREGGDNPEAQAMPHEAGLDVTQKLISSLELCSSPFALLFLVKTLAQVLPAQMHMSKLLAESRFGLASVRILCHGPGFEELRKSQTSRSAGGFLSSFMSTSRSSNERSRRQQPQQSSIFSGFGAPPAAAETGNSIFDDFDASASKAKPRNMLSGFDGPGKQGGSIFDEFAAAAPPAPQQPQSSIFSDFGVPPTSSAANRGPGAGASSIFDDFATAPAPSAPAQSTSVFSDFDAASSTSRKPSQSAPAQPTSIFSDFDAVPSTSQNCGQLTGASAGSIFDEFATATPSTAKASGSKAGTRAVSEPESLDKRVTFQPNFEEMQLDGDDKLWLEYQFREHLQQLAADLTLGESAALFAYTDGLDVFNYDDSDVKLIPIEMASRRGPHFTDIQGKMKRSISYILTLPYLRSNEEDEYGVFLQRVIRRGTDLHGGRYLALIIAITRSQDSKASWRGTVCLSVDKISGNRASLNLPISYSTILKFFCAQISEACCLRTPSMDVLGRLVWQLHLCIDLLSDGGSVLPSDIDLDLMKEAVIAQREAIAVVVSGTASFDLLSRALEYPIYQEEEELEKGAGKSRPPILSAEFFAKQMEFMHELIRRACSRTAERAFTSQDHSGEFIVRSKKHPVFSAAARVLTVNYIRRQCQAFYRESRPKKADASLPAEQPSLTWNPMFYPSLRPVFVLDSLGLQSDHVLEELYGDIVDHPEVQEKPLQNIVAWEQQLHRRLAAIIYSIDPTSSMLYPEYTEFLEENEARDETVVQAMVRIKSGLAFHSVRMRPEGVEKSPHARPPSAVAFSSGDAQAWFLRSGAEDSAEGAAHRLIRMTDTYLIRALVPVKKHDNLDTGMDGNSTAVATMERAQGGDGAKARVHLPAMQAMYTHADSPLDHKTLLNPRQLFRLVEPWETEPISEGGGSVIRSGILGRNRYIPLPKDASHLLFDLLVASVFGEEDDEGSVETMETYSSSKDDIKLPFGRMEAVNALKRMWLDLNGESWLLHALGNAVFPDELQARSLRLASALPPPPLYTGFIATFLQRNLLLRRIHLPHRFTALVQIELLELKNLSPSAASQPSSSRGSSPQPPSSGMKPSESGGNLSGMISSGSAASSTAGKGKRSMWDRLVQQAGSKTMEVYTVQRLKRIGSSVQLSNSSRTIDSIVTPVQTVDLVNDDTVPNPSEATGASPWSCTSTFRFALPEDFPEVSWRESVSYAARGVPQIVHVCVYEKKAFFNDALVGDIELPLAELSNERPLEEWLPLRCDRGSSWFVSVRASLRFVTMTLEEKKIKRRPAAARRRSASQIPSTLQSKLSDDAVELRPPALSDLEVLPEPSTLLSTDGKETSGTVTSNLPAGEDGDPDEEETEGDTIRNGEERKSNSERLKGGLKSLGQKIRPKERAGKAKESAGRAMSRVKNLARIARRRKEQEKEHEDTEDRMSVALFMDEH